MVIKKEQERRRFPRYPLTGEVRAWEVPMLKSARHALRAARAIEARIENVGTGGMCLVASRPIKVSHPVRGEIRFSKIPTSIPVMMQVRWAEKLARKKGYRIGLRFLL